MDSILNILSQGSTGTVVGLMGIVLAVTFYLRSRRKARLAFQYYHVTFVGGLDAVFPDEVEIRFAGTVVPRITGSRIVIWNCGDRTVDGKNLVAGDPLRVEIPQEGQILRHTILRQTRGVNGWKVDRSTANRLDITFDFVDPGDGFSLEVIHTQLGSELDVVGTIRGIPKGLLDYGPAPWFGVRGSRTFVFSRFRGTRAVGVVIGASLALYGVFFLRRVDRLTSFGVPGDLDILAWSFIAIGVLYAVTYGLTFRRRRYPAILEP